MELLDEQHLREMVYGGAVLGGGGGGSISAGLIAGQAALARGRPRLIEADVMPAEARVVTLSMVGTVTGMAGAQSTTGLHMVALRRLTEVAGLDVDGLIASEVGPAAIVYGWPESATTGIPIVDAPCNGRAHPLGLMGSLGLHRFPKHITTTVAVGGRNKTSVELALKTNITTASTMVRHASAQYGVPLAVARNPLPMSYVRKHAAIGAIRQARRIGKIFLENVARGLPAVLQAISRLTRGRVLARGRVESVTVADRDGLTVGHIVIQVRNVGEALIAICNEYMTIIRNGSLLAAFPDLITVFDCDNGLPLGSNEVRQGQTVEVFGISRRYLKLGSPMNDKSLLRPIERLLNLRLTACRHSGPEPRQQ